MSAVGKSYFNYGNFISGAFVHISRNVNFKILRTPLRETLLLHLLNRSHDPTLSLNALGIWECSGIWESLPLFG